MASNAVDLELSKVIQTVQKMKFFILLPKEKTK